MSDRNDLNACVEVLEPEDIRAAFDFTFRRFSQSMDMLLPDPRALPYQGDLRWLGKIRGAAQARYNDDRLDLSGCGEKVRKLIADAVAADGTHTARSSPARCNLASFTAPRRSVFTRSPCRCP